MQVASVITSCCPSSAPTRAWPHSPSPSTRTWPASPSTTPRCTPHLTSPRWWPHPAPHPGGRHHRRPPLLRGAPQPRPRHQHHRHTPGQGLQLPGPQTYSNISGINAEFVKCNLKLTWKRMVCHQDKNGSVLSVFGGRSFFSSASPRKHSLDIL